MPTVSEVYGKLIEKGSGRAISSRLTIHEDC